jgi:hypothetical protein
VDYIMSGAVIGVLVFLLALAISLFTGKSAEAIA